MPDSSRSCGELMEPALTNIGNSYKEFGLKKNATTKYDQALHTCEEIMNDARKLGGRMLEDTYVQLWQIYYEMDKLELAAAMCQRLRRSQQSIFLERTFRGSKYVSSTSST